MENTNYLLKQMNSNLGAKLDSVVSAIVGNGGGFPYPIVENTDQALPEPGLALVASKAEIWEYDGNGLWLSPWRSAMLAHSGLLLGQSQAAQDEKLYFHRGGADGPWRYRLGTLTIRFLPNEPNDSANYWQFQLRCGATFPGIARFTDDTSDFLQGVESAIVAPLTATVVGYSTLWVTSVGSPGAIWYSASLNYRDVMDIVPA